MSDQENSTSNEPAVIAESAPANQLEEANAVVTESAPVEEPASENTEEKGSEPSKAVKELIAQRKRRQAAEQDAAYWRGVAEARQAPEPKEQPVQQRQSTDDIKPPSSDQFETWEEFEHAKDQYLVDKAKAEMRKEFQQQQVKQQQVKIETSFWDKVSSIEEKEDPYIRETITNVGKMVNPVVADLVVASDDGIELVKYLNNNPKEAKRLSGLSPLMAAKEIGKLEYSLSNKPKAEPVKKVSQAPTPIKTVTPSGSTNTFDPETASMEEYYSRRMAQLRPTRK